MSDPVVPAPVGPCEAYAIPEDITVAEICEAPTEAIEAMLAVASDIVWVLLGRPNVGVCEVTIYPCQQRHRWRWWGHRNEYPLGVNGPCVGCGPDEGIRLDTPVRDVAEVVVGGEVLSTDDYYLLDGVWLVRCAGAWPGGSDCDFEDFSVSYSYGEEVSYLIRQATIEVVVDLWNSRPSETSDLPGVNSVNRQGIGWSAETEIERVSHMGMALPSLAKAVEVYNPTRQPHQAWVWSPDEGFRNRSIRTF